ncbi:MFS permease [Vibrio astriarenae]|nr:MFS permease [Vibrio sp. C7]
MKLSRSGEFSLLLVASLTVMVGSALAPGLTTVSQALGVSEYATFLITLPALGAILFAPLFGMLIDNIGSRTTLLISLIGYFAFGLGGVFVEGVWFVSINRILLGGFAAGCMASGTALISLWYSGPNRLKMIAKQGMAIELGGAVFLFLGGILSEYNWRGPFTLYALGLVSFVLVLLSIPNENKKLEKVTHNNTDKVSRMGSVVIYTILSMALFFSLFVTIPQQMATLLFTEAQTGYLLSFISIIAVIAAMVMPRMVSRFTESTTVMISFLAFAFAHWIFAYSTSIYLLILAALSAGVWFWVFNPFIQS